MSGELSMDQVLIKKLTDVLDASLENEQFGVKELTEAVGMSRAQLHRKLRDLTRKSTSQFIREYRLEKAMKMLQNNIATASEIAYRVGFKSPTYFNTSFHNYYGYSPGEVKYRNSLTKENNTIIQIKEQNSSDKDKSIDSKIEKISFRQRMILLFSVGLMLIIAFSYYFYFNSKEIISADTTESIINEKSIAIIPLKNLSEDNDDEYFAKGMRASIQNYLSKIAGLKVISEISMEKYANTSLTASEIAKEVGVSYLLDGSVQKYGDSIRIIIHFIGAKDDQQLSSMVFDEEFNHLFAIQSNIAKQVAKDLNITLSPSDLEEIEKNPTDKLEAYKMYLKGRFYWHQRTEKGLNQSISYFNQAIAIDSKYALAYAGLADCYLIMVFYGWISKNDGFNKSKELAEKALSIDNNLAEAHATLGGIAAWYDWKWEDAERQLKLAISLNPNYATAHHYYAELLSVLGTEKEVREQIDLALELNPHSLTMNRISAHTFFNEGKYEKAIKQGNKALDLNKNDKLIWYDRTNIIKNYIYLGRNMEAIELIKNAISADPSLANFELLDKEYQESGIKGVIYWLIDWILINKSKGNAPVHIATWYALIGDSQNTLNYLERAFEDGAVGLPGITNNREFNSIKSEPRFIALLEKMGLENHVKPIDILK